MAPSEGPLNIKTEQGKSHSGLQVFVNTHWLNGLNKLSIFVFTKEQAETTEKQRSIVLVVLPLRLCQGTNSSVIKSP